MKKVAIINILYVVAKSVTGGSVMKRDDEDADLGPGSETFKTSTSSICGFTHSTELHRARFRDA